MGIFIAATVSSFLLAALGGHLLITRRVGAERWSLFLMRLIYLPLSALAFHALRLPLKHRLAEPLWS